MKETIERMEELIKDLNEGLENGTASDPAYCMGLVALLKHKILEARVSWERSVLGGETNSERAMRLSAEEEEQA